MERRDDIIRDFTVVRDVLGLSEREKELGFSASAKGDIGTSFNYTDKRLPLYKGFENNIESCLSLSHTKIASISELAKAHAHNGVLLLPNMDVTMAVIAAAGKAWFHIAYVSVAWKSFDVLENLLMCFQIICKGHRTGHIYKIWSGAAAFFVASPK